MSIDISIHAPRVGRDGPEGHRRWLHHYFNPRAPCGARPAAPAEDYVTRKISIHAPRVGRDNRLATANLSAQIFQSTRPVWGATPPHGIDAEMVVKFQSTRPVWGATPCDDMQSVAPAISIHAPRVGRDGLLCSIAHIALPFQSTRPVWGATFRLRAPLQSPRYFNPRAPCGARPRFCSRGRMVSSFQSTRPVWGATQDVGQDSLRRYISIHAPRVGRDELASRERKALTRFQSTRPVWGATDCRSRGRLSSRISIHAPRVGRDHALPSPPA